MPVRLKRGLPRESCNFCHGRKIKCDRSLRAKEGHTSCSQCALRQSPCRLDDPTETRTPSRARETARGGKTGLNLGDGDGILPRGDNPEATPFASTSQPEPLQLQEYDQSTSIHYPDIMFDENFLTLSRDNIFFLDQVFMDDNGEARWLADDQGVGVTISNTSNIDEGLSGLSEQQAQQSTEISSWPDGVTDSNTAFTAAINCYFKFAAPWLPILLEDAFWEDYRNGRASHVLASAVACRGMPFTAVPDRWNIQQRFARDFREAYLGARSIASDDGSIRLDDLEALALMVNFEYDDTDTPPLHSNLGRLFLKHESLVLMTLQSRIQDRVSTSSGSMVSLARARERRVLLYWHVYGLDAFHCLDRKQISLIPDKNKSENGNLPPHEVSDFLDAVLELAVIARKLLQRLCSESAKRSGVEPNDVHDLYEQIYHWRNQTCPPHLRRHEESLGVLATQDKNEDYPTEMQRHIQLHRAVLWALEINCLMQVECAVSDFGIRDSANLRADITAARVKYESLRALNNTISICHWIDLHTISDEDGKQHSLVDLAPLALRNVCAGLCYWSCQNLNDTYSTQISKKPALSDGRQARTDGQNHTMDDRIQNAKLLRDTAAKATSHRDTADILARLDKQITMFKATLSNASEAGS
ncbi:hypothetical protein N7481_000136 [Penicillium waksmanii]|uniref:uncharacterized protein n=1 Tax=Penicillium waksmanii TaxID=69791 RepID=UPI0025476288|nr:uncharacterized protein N7481_000136 [Penicillium waksmanii]KAJ5999727.1 hypothetical protein N7481_000136 [Penicillium waksmanii]